MLSFCGTGRLHGRWSCGRSQNKKKTMSLQVRCSPRSKELWTENPGKRVLPFTSKYRLKASMTVEAALVLPLFLFVSLALWTPVRMLDTQRQMQTALERNCEELSLYAYLSEESWETEDVELATTYREKIPFFPGVLPALSLETASKRRKWIGYPGKWTGEQDGDFEEDDGEVMVYVGKEMGRYHPDRNCHYISNTYEAVSLEDAMGMRDADGHRFTACESCASQIRDDGTVYVTPAGRHYHGSVDCSAMISYVRKVPLSEVEHLGACSYCGK